MDERIFENKNLTVPAVALRGLSILPGMAAHFDISREKSLHAVEAALSKDCMLYLVTQKDPEAETPNPEELYHMGLLAEVRQIVRMKNDVVRVLINGIARAEWDSFTEAEQYFEAEITVREDEYDPMLPESANAAMLESVRENFRNYAESGGKNVKEKARQIDGMTELSSLLDYVGNSLPVEYTKRQKILETCSITERYELVLSMIFQELEIEAFKNEFQDKVRGRVDRRQKEYLLKEQMNVIREELGIDDFDSGIDEYKSRTEALNADEKIKNRIRKEIRRLESLSENSSESSVSRGYIETLLELPWNNRSEEHRSLRDARQILDEDHYGLKDVKERVLEFLAVRNLTEKGDAPILCLVGPPGCGKTSVARSIARTIGKEYVRISLGGVRDEAEIRGHRKTYVGAMPGRIIEGLKQAKVSNPLMLLDEIDKSSGDHRGDTASALLEVLDSEQNSHFRDHYVEIPVDLSDVLFLATANDRGAIPRPLLDRMEIIEVPGYTANEKFHIGKEHLIAKQLRKNGLTKAELVITDKALRAVIAGYTREAGVRELERKIGTICRKAARAVYEGEKQKVSVTVPNLKDYLGAVKYLPEKADKGTEVGIVRGLAWTAVGGVTLEIEVNVLPGKGVLQLTGKLGDVMKESAQTALSYVRFLAERYNIEAGFFERHDIHVHIPEGATPKDGPSAGVALTCAILSAVTGIPVRGTVAMTGEVTLRGRVLPVGGLKEKLLAANMAGIQTVCIPKDNMRDLEEIDAEIIGEMDVIPTAHVSENIKICFAG